LLAEVAASAVVTAHSHVLRRWLRAGGQGDVEAQLDHAFAIVRDTFGTGIGAGRTGSVPSAATAAGGGEPAGAAARATATGDVLVAVARTDAPLEEIMGAIERTLKSR
ncbi:TetR family transcriptional regulator, partial [Streptomyces solincola]